jgi:hypothetical protein
MTRIQCHIIRVAGATSGCLVSVKNMMYQRFFSILDEVLGLRDRRKGQTRLKHSGHWVLPVHERRLNKLKMQRDLAAQKDYWNCYCELRFYLS